MKFMSVATSSGNHTWRPFAKKRKQSKWQTMKLAELTMARWEQQNIDGLHFSSLYLSICSTM